MSSSKATLSPYLNFNGQTAEAMKFYQSVLGGNLEMQTFGEANMAQAAEQNDMIVHANLKSENITIMASDARPETPVTFGDSVHLSLTVGESEKLKGVFSRLSQGGKVDMPLEKQFWGDVFGMVTDRFGIHWMVNISSQD